MNAPIPWPGFLFGDWPWLMIIDGMNRLTRNALGLAIGSAALAGFVDATGFLELRGLFVSFMSGNSTQFAVGIAKGNWRLVAALGGILFLFVAGTFCGTLIGHYLTPKFRVPGVLGLTAALLFAAGLCEVLAIPKFAIALMTLAMGAENAAFQRDGEVVVGLTYMTGTLVKFGQKLASAFVGGPPWEWLPHLGLWLGLVGGGLIGAIVYLAIGLTGVWGAAAIAATLAIFAWRAHITAS